MDEATDGRLLADELGANRFSMLNTDDLRAGSVFSLDIFFDDAIFVGC